MAIWKSLEKYLELVAGGGATLAPIVQPLHALPVYISHSYEFAEGQLFGLKLLYARRTAGSQSSIRLRADHDALVRVSGEASVVLVLENISSATRRRLVMGEVPFIVPGRQIFLPTVLVDLRERQPGPGTEPKEHVGWVAQVVFLRHLLHGDIEGRMLAQVAATCAYSAMAISKAQRQLVGHGLARLRTVGRAKYLVFDEARHALWDRALERLRRPWSKVHPVLVTDAARSPRTWIAGVDALARTSMLAPGRIPTVAMMAADLRHALESGQLVTSPEADDAEFLVESWRYAPDRLTGTDVVDPLSLYLCLRDDPDERVQIALEGHMDAFAW